VRAQKHAEEDGEEDEEAAAGSCSEHFHVAVAPVREGVPDHDAAAALSVKLLAHLLRLLLHLLQLVGNDELFYVVDSVRQRQQPVAILLRVNLDGFDLLLDI